LWFFQLISPYFTLCGEKWCWYIYPYGYAGELNLKDNMSLYLRYKGKKRKIEVEFTISAHTSNENGELCCYQWGTVTMLFGSTGNEEENIVQAWGRHKFCKREEFLSKLVDDKLILKLQMTVTTPKGEADECWNSNLEFEEQKKINNGKTKDSFR